MLSFLSGASIRGSFSIRNLKFEITFLTNRFRKSAVGCRREILGFRSLNALVHQIVMQKIREAKSLVPTEEFANLVEAQKRESQKRSQIKSSERLEMIGALAPYSKHSLPMIEATVESPKKKKIA